MTVPHHPADSAPDGRLEDRAALAAARAEAGPSVSTARALPSEARAHARHRWREWPVAIVLAGVAISLFVVVDNHFRRGSVLLALSVLLAGGLRLVLPARAAGVLAVRSRAVDVLILGGLGAGLLVLALVVPPPR